MALLLIPSVHPGIVQTLFQYYIYDMTEYTGWSPNAEGSFAVENSATGLDDYWQLPNHFPYLIQVDNDITGFSLIREYPEEPGRFDIGQFFVLRKYKRHGIGRMAFQELLKMHPGNWLTRVLPDNTGAKRFWLNIISDATDGQYSVTEEQYKDKPMLFIRYSNR